MNPYLHINRLELILTDRCTGRCRHCSAGERVAHPRREAHVPVDASVGAIRFLAEHYDMHSVMTFGGEPLLYPEAVCGIHRAAAEWDIPCRQIITNGYFSREETRIREVAQSDSVSAYQGEIALTQTAADATLDEKVTNIFLSIGIPAHIKGYQYLREAVRMVVEDHDLINRITKELYPGIARRFSTTASKVERAMRHAIEVAWNRGRLDSVNRIYGYKVFSENDKPTNGEFIALIADKVIMRQSA